MSFLRNEWEAKCKAAMDDMYAEADRIGGLVSGEHGIGHAKQEYLEKCVGPVEMQLCRILKRYLTRTLYLIRAKFAINFNVFSPAGFMPRVK